MGKVASGQSLPETPAEVLRLRGAEGLLLKGLVRLAEWTGFWRHGRRGSGDLQTMTAVDKAYWIYKARHPVVHARRGSRLEAHFAAQRLEDLRLPERFVPEARLSTSAAGDLITHPFLARSPELYREVADLLFGADLPMANLECCILPSADVAFEFTSKSGPALAYDPQTFRASKGDGSRQFAFMSAACNHSLDFGAEGVASTIAALRSEGIAFAGINESADDAARATILERNGLRLGILAFTFGLNARPAPPDKPWIVNRAALNDGPGVELSQLEQQLAFCRAERVDFVIAQLHWGLEHELYPTPEQVELAHLLAERGVDAIIGHHPHVLQPVELYRTRRDPDRLVPVFYSLGNLLNTFSAAHLCRSGVARLVLARGRTAGGEPRTYVERASLAEVIQEADPALGTLRLRPALRG